MTTNIKNNPDALGSSPFCKTYDATALGSDLNFVTDGGTLCRMIVVNAAGGGAINILLGDDTTDTQPGRQQGDEIKIKAKGVKASGTTITNITVYW